MHGLVAITSKNNLLHNINRLFDYLPENKKVLLCNELKDAWYYSNACTAIPGKRFSQRMKREELMKTEKMGLKKKKANDLACTDYSSYERQPES